MVSTAERPAAFWEGFPGLGPGNERRLAYILHVLFVLARMWAFCRLPDTLARSVALRRSPVGA